MKVKGFIRSLNALEPRLGQVVLAGGWCWYLYRKYLTGETGLPGEFTLDVDLVLPRQLRAAGPSLEELLAANDFETRMEGEERPPVTSYVWPPSPNAPDAIVEFITPTAGDGSVPTATVDGVVAQALRFVDLLLDEPAELTIDERDGEDRFAGRVRVPGVGYFVLQKALTFRRRQHSQKRYKDLFYIFDVADKTRGLIPRIEGDLRSCERKRGRNWIDSAATALEEDCGTPESDAIGRVLQQIPEEQRPSRTYVADTFGLMVQIMRAK